MAALLAMYEFGFEALRLERIRANILADNRRAIRFNEALGFRLQPGQQAQANRLYLLARADFVARSGRFRAYLRAAFGA
jgi:RimJ/RimL family protein N-acetyltransferase